MKLYFFALLLALACAAQFESLFGLPFFPTTKAPAKATAKATAAAKATPKATPKATTKKPKSTANKKKKTQKPTVKAKAVTSAPCPGAVGPVGAPGVPGTNGTNGLNGTIGVNGTNGTNFARLCTRVTNSGEGNTTATCTTGIAVVGYGDCGNSTILSSSLDPAVSGSGTQASTGWFVECLAGNATASAICCKFS